jgi:hypothetical protein
MLFSIPRISATRGARSALGVGFGAMTLLVGVADAQHAHAPPAVATASLVSATPDAAGAPASLWFDSVLSRYKPMTDQKLGSWREANDTVARIGGWRAYLKESQTPEGVLPTPTVPSPKVGAPTTPVTPNPHAGHGVKP